MKKENVIKSAKQDYPNFTETHRPMSDELQKAIQNLIHQLRELGPLPN